MDIVLKGRGVHITGPLRTVVEHKVGKLERLDPAAMRVEVEVISERNPKLDGATRIEGALHIPRKVLRAKAESRDIGEALDQMVERLGRQLRDHRSKRRKRPGIGSNRVESSPKVEVEPD